MNYLSICLFKVLFYDDFLKVGQVKHCKSEGMRQLVCKLNLCYVLSLVESR